MVNRATATGRTARRLSPGRESERRCASLPLSFLFSFFLFSSVVFHIFFSFFFFFFINRLSRRTFAITARSSYGFRLLTAVFLFLLLFGKPPRGKEDGSPRTHWNGNGRATRSDGDLALKKIPRLVSFRRLPQRLSRSFSPPRCIFYRCVRRGYDIIIAPAILYDFNQVCQGYRGYWQHERDNPRRQIDDNITLRFTVVVRFICHKWR